MRRGNTRERRSRVWRWTRRHLRIAEPVRCGLMTLPSTGAWVLLIRADRADLVRHFRRYREEISIPLND